MYLNVYNPILSYPIFHPYHIIRCGKVHRPYSFQVALELPVWKSFLMLLCGEGIICPIS